MLSLFHLLKVRQLPYLGVISLNPQGVNENTGPWVSNLFMEKPKITTHQNALFSNSPRLHTNFFKHCLVSLETPGHAKWHRGVSTHQILSLGPWPRMQRQQFKHCRIFLTLEVRGSNSNQGTQYVLLAEVTRCCPGNRISPLKLNQWQRDDVNLKSCNESRLNQNILN